MVEGLIQGGVGRRDRARRSLGGLFCFGGRQAPMLAGAIDPSSIVFLSAPMCAALLAGGMVVGCVGGLIAARSAREIVD